MLTKVQATTTKNNPALMPDTHRVFNFSAGPAMMPTEVLAHAQAELLNWHGTGMSIMEMSHRGSDYTAVAETAEADLRDLLNIPDNYKVLFMQGGATSQFAMIPLNLLGNARLADYVDTGVWSQKAIKEARNYTSVNICASAEDDNYKSVPNVHNWKISKQAAYLHLTPNETIGGLEFTELPEIDDIPIVADMSSTILSRPIDVSRFGVIYAGAQKNIGPAGLTLVIIRDDLLDHPLPQCPGLYQYKLHSDAHSMLNTPPTFAWYLAGLVFKWLKAQGGLVRMAEINARKARKLYAAIDENDFYENAISADNRSYMNVPFTLQRPEFDARFLSEAEQSGLTNLKGHRSTGGMRASIYNAMPEIGVDALVSFMQKFAMDHA